MNVCMYIDVLKRTDSIENPTLKKVSSHAPYYRTTDLQLIVRSAFQLFLSETIVWPSGNFWRTFGNLLKVRKSVRKIVRKVVVSVLI